MTTHSHEEEYKFTVDPIFAFGRPDKFIIVKTLFVLDIDHPNRSFGNVISFDTTDLDITPNQVTILQKQIVANAISYAVEKANDLVLEMDKHLFIDQNGLYEEGDKEVA